MLKKYLTSVLANLRAEFFLTIPNYNRCDRLIYTVFGAFLTLTNPIAPVLAQSTDSKQPAPLQSGDNIAVIHSAVQIPQYYYMTVGPGKGELTIDFSSNGFPGGGQIGITLISEKNKKSKTYIATSNQVPFSSDVAKTDRLIVPFNTNTATKIVVRIDPPSSGLLVAAGRYNLQVTGAVKFAERDPNPKQDPVVGTYRIFNSLFGNGSSNQLVKLLPDGNIQGANGGSGSWSLFDASSRTYVLKFAGKQKNLIFWPAVGFSEQPTGNPDIELVK